MKNLRPRLVLLYLIVGVFSNVGLLGAPAPDLLTTLGKQLQDYSNAHQASTEPGVSRMRILANSGQVLDQALADGNVQDIKSFLNEISLMPDLPSDLKATLAQLQRDLPGMMEAAADKYVVDVDAIIAATRQACLAAKTEKDLDPMLKSLGVLRRPRMNSNSPLVQRQMSKVEAAIQFVTHWQDALAQRDAGNVNSASDIMQQLAKDTHYPIMTQDEIRAHIPAREPPPVKTPTAGASRAVEQTPAVPDAGVSPQLVLEVLIRIKNLDDLDTAVSELSKLGPASQMRPATGVPSVGEEAGIARGYIEALQKAYAEYGQGFYDDAIRSSTSYSNNNPHDWMKEIVRLRGVFVKMILPKYLALPAAEKPAADENAMDFLLRMAAEAKRDHRWSDLKMSLEAYRQFAFGNFAAAASSGPPDWLATDIANCGDFVAGQNLEAGGNLVEAILAYQRVLQQPGNYSPTAEAVARLQALQKGNPDSYQAALKQAELQVTGEELHQKILAEVQQMLRTMPGGRGASLTPTGRSGFQGR